MKIQIGNSFNVQWTFTQLGEAFDFSNKDIVLSISCSYGVIQPSNIEVNGNVLQFTVPGENQVYSGKYDVSVLIRDSESGQQWRVIQCDAFELSNCFVPDMAEIIQLNSGIVYPTSGKTPDLSQYATIEYVNSIIVESINSVY